MRFETVFQACANEPARACVRPAPTRAWKVQDCATVHPAATNLCVNEPAILDEADAACRRADPVLAHRAECRRRQSWMAEGRSVEVAFDAKQKMTRLKIVAGLNATNEFGKAAVEIVVWNT